MKTERNYDRFLRDISRFIPQDRIFTNELHRLAWGTDAGFCRLIPLIVVNSIDDDEVFEMIYLTDRYNIPVAFRAVGTSLSGQSISDFILIIAGKSWDHYELSPDHEQVCLGPGIIGQRVNEILAPYGHKFAPNSTSIKSAMVGGIVMNDASGMNCRTHTNSDKMLLLIRIILPDGYYLNTTNQKFRENFEEDRPDFLHCICGLRDWVRNSKELSACIRYKYSIKNVTGLNILPFLIYDDPFGIAIRLMVDSEGTLAFLSGMTMRTEYDCPYKASAMFYFSGIKEACRAVVAMKKLANTDGEWIVKGAEPLDWESLTSVSSPTGEELTVVLTETKARTQEELNHSITVIKDTLKVFRTYVPVYFTDRPKEYSKYWAIRSGIFPSVGGTHPPGITCLIEDVTFHIESLPEATAELQQLIARHGYDDACTYGYALEGNYHFIINQSFSNEVEMKRCETLINDIKKLVMDKYDGSLKAERDTKRNMAPFVKQEWGEEVFAAIKAVKQLFGPKGLFNPGVIFNSDPQCHVEHFKPLSPLAIGEGSEVARQIDRCIEYGFYEVNRLSCGFTLSSHQHIVIQREISRLKENGENSQLLETLFKLYRYSGNQTCIGDGLCTTFCPMGINTGDLAHLLRQAGLPSNSTGYKAGKLAANHFTEIENALRPVLSLANTTHNLLGTSRMTSITRRMHNVWELPQWTPAMPMSYKIHKKDNDKASGAKDRVIYFPGCINQTMGLAKSSPVEQPLVNKILSLPQKVGYEVISPPKMEKLCYGTIWESKGTLDVAGSRSAELGAALWETSEQRRYPVLCDQSPCLHRMRATIQKVKLYEPIEFTYTFLRDKLEFTPTDRPVAIHITCSIRKMGLSSTLISLTGLCSTQVLVPGEVGCCGFAGDKGFTRPGLNTYTLRKLRPQLEKAGISIGYSNSRTCEISSATNADIPYVSIAYLVDQCTHPREAKE